MITHIIYFDRSVLKCKTLLSDKIVIRIFVIENPLHCVYSTGLPYKNKILALLMNIQIILTS